MKINDLVVQLAQLQAKHGNLDIILQADHYGYDDARGVEYTLYDGDEGTYDCPEEAPEEARPVAVIFV